MDKCPVCNSPLNPQDESCAACGYRLQDTTEEFKVVSLEPDTTDVPSSTTTTREIELQLVDLQNVRCS